MSYRIDHIAHPATVLTLAALAAACGARTGLDDHSDAHTDAAPACDASVAHAYAADSAGTIYRYDPHTGQATSLGSAHCAMSGGAWTMTATRQHAYLVDDLDWSLFEVDLATMRCTRT